MPEGYSIGQTVVLKSGGPVMAVIAVAGSTITCRWFFGNVLTQADFISESLVNVPASPPLLQANNVWTAPL